MQAIYAEAKLARQAGWFSRRHQSPGCREELGSSRELQCGVCIDHDNDAPGYTSRGDAHLMAVTAPGVR